MPPLDLDPEGYLRDLSQWSPEVAQQLALKEGIELTERHWQVLQALRDFYAHFQLSPANRPLIKYIAQTLGPELGTSLQLNLLFKGAPAKLGAKLAGLPKPDNCL
ncbi:MULTISPECIES: TusE/DsrC/DsvC family sulfur relay protein [Pseudomonas]|jgi:tRNA 2-thiouridine synthesizing protein E|uniref:Sulfurtransferase n=1 Tax=Pseudomonas flavocrustae TaxID=2991719 RepID=A0ABT6IE47_9PSED|nr:MULTISPECIES: TusE/DsrC/DsvC family sulfur relay protein [Pseudomonas]MDH4762798.1 TusE/DsrC/DsvC family sulfur relay protein [Pseudomonas sp. CBMAI 2609]MDK8265658.1 TusE/DsrC/DsvC family sulfur relay protein [Pseudomonas oryzihabitans]QNQ99277.1 sulfurtransferase TusE [Pseudomonas psychrotolerans]